MMKMSYYCGYKSFSEFICIQHTNFAGRKARKWWSERTDTPMPETTAEAINIADKVLAAPTHIRVWTNKQYPEIMAFCYDGTAFGTQESDGYVPEIENREQLSAQRAELANRTYADDLDDDIPF